MKITKAQYDKAYQDYKYILTTYGDAYDYCGSWCNSVVLGSILKNPTLGEVYKQLIGLIQYYFDHGIEPSGSRLKIDSDPKLKEIYETYRYE